MDFFFYSFSESKIKPQLKMAVQRIKIVVNKKSSQVKHQKKEIAVLLKENRTEKARIKVEHIIREDFLIESFELIELLCELVHERIKYIASQKECPEDVLQAVVSLIWSSIHVDIVELDEVKKQLIAKYGKKFGENAIKNENNLVNERLFEKLSSRPPSSFLVHRYLQEIAKEYNVDWSPPSDIDLTLPHLPVSSPQGFSIAMAPGSELANAYEKPSQQNEQSTSVINPPTPSIYAATVRSNNYEPTFYPPPMYPPETQRTNLQIAVPINEEEERMRRMNKDADVVTDSSYSIVNRNDNENDINSFRNDNNNDNDNNEYNNNNSNDYNNNNNDDDNSNNNDNNSNNNGDDISFDELTARFNALK